MLKQEAIDRANYIDEQINAIAGILKCKSSEIIAILDKKLSHKDFLYSECIRIAAILNAKDDGHKDTKPVVGT